MNDATHRQIWEMIPWYVNDTLDADTRDTVDVHIAQCESCRAEIASQARIATLLSEDSALEQSAWSNWEDVASRIDPSAPQPQTLWERLGDWLTANKPTLAPTAALAAATCAVVVVASIWQAPTVYRTLTTPSEETLEGELRLRAVPGTDHAALLRDLEAYGLTVISGTASDTLIRVVPPVDVDGRTDALDALRQDPRIAVIAGAEE